MNSLSMNPALHETVWTTINLAIATQRVIQLKFNNTWRTLEPYQLGYPNQDQELLTIYGYCRDIVPNEFTPSRWQLVDLENIEQIELTNYWFQPQAEYTEQQNMMQFTFCQLAIQGKVPKKRLPKKRPIVAD